jgi:transposase
MDTLHRRCAGLDVHKDTVVACVRSLDGHDRVRSEVRTFRAVTGGLLELLDWLTACGVTVAAMEATGVYWKPVFNVLEGPLSLMLVNPEHIKQVPGRKTDVKDCEWIARLLQHGLLRASFVPPRPVRELRDLTRQRTQLVAERGAASNRIQKVLEDANVKLGSVASDVLGVSGRSMLEAIIGGEEDPSKLAELARRKMRAKIPQLREALRGRVTAHHRFLLRLHLDHVTQLEGLIGRLEERVGELIAADRPPDPPPEGPSAVPPSGDAGRSPPGLWQALLLLVTIPGVSRRTAEVILAEVGTDMGRFATSGHLASWAGLCPGNDESAGKRRSGRTRHGDRWLRQALVQAAWAASRTATYLGAQHRRLARRLGRKQATVAVAHTLLGMVYQVLKKGEPYRELGADYFDQLGTEQLTRQLVKRLERLGHKVTLDTPAA